MVYAISIAALINIFLLVGCAIESIKTKTSVSLALGKLHILAIVSIIFCFLTYIMPTATLARLMLGVYCLSFDISLYALAVYVRSYEKNDNGFSFIVLIRYCYLVLAFIDAIFLILSAFTGICFNVEPYIHNSIHTWIISFNTSFTYHLGLCYAISFYIFIRITKNTLQIASFYRPRFFLILCLFAAEVIANMVFITSPEYWVYDFSSLFYGIMVIVCFAVTVYSVPRTIKKRIVGIASESVSDAVICFDYKGKCIFINETANKFYNANSDEWVITFLKSDKDYFIKTINLEIEGEVLTCKVEFRRFYDKRKKLLGSYIKLNDYTDEIKKIKQEEYRASHDSLTGLLNRESFFKEAQKVLSAEPLVPRYMVCTDIKNFKMFNELFGAENGDLILKMQAEMLNYAKYDKVVIGRISGDKFAMLIRQRDFKPELAVNNTRRIYEVTEDIQFPLTIFIGVYEIQDANENVRSMYDKAYMAIKNIQEGNNTRIVFYDSSLLNRIMEEKNIISRFDNALANNQFVFFLQSQINSKNNKCEGAEALVRWNYPEKGILPPSDYINILEKSGQIYKLDKYIWEEVVKVLKDWQTRGINKYISVNVSVKDFYYIDVYKELTELVEKYGVSPSKLNIEITESVLSNRNQSPRDTVIKLQKYGFKIEMDDFGSGYSSLNLLKDISMDVLKIDMGFLARTENSERAFLIINAITKMAKNLGMQIIAEGVETEVQTEILVKANVDLFQGYLYSKPISLSEFEEKYLGENK